MQQKQLYGPFISLFQYLNENAQAFRALLGDQGDPSFAKKMKQIFGETIGNRIITLTPLAKDNAFQQYLLAFWTSAILGVIQQWLENCEEQTVDEMAHIHFKLLELISNTSHIIVK